MNCGFSLVRWAGLIAVLCLAMSGHRELFAQTVPQRVDTTIQPDEIDGVPLGKLSGKRTDSGLHVVHNLPDDRFTLDIVGQNFKPQHSDRLIWAVDDKVIQILAMPLDDAPEPENAQKALLNHQAWENEHIGNAGWREVVSAREWLKFASNDLALYWELDHPDPPGNPDSRVIRHVFVTALNGANIVVINLPVTTAMDADACRHWAKQTMLSLSRYPALVERERNQTPPNDTAAATKPSADTATESLPSPATAMGTVISSKWSSPRERAEASVTIVDHAQLMEIVRLQLALDTRPLIMTEITDGQTSHMFLLQKYDAEEVRYMYQDSRGKESYLSEGNNLAGVKAQPHPDLHNTFYVTDPEMRTVIRGIISEAQFIRLVAYTGDLQLSAQEYSRLHAAYPNDAETSEARLLRAGEIFVELQDLPRAQTTFAVCWHLHPNSSRALAGIATVFNRAGNAESAANFYRSALETLSKDNSQDATAREALQNRWKKESELLSR